MVGTRIWKDMAIESSKSITIFFVRHGGQLGWDKNRIRGFCSLFVAFTSLLGGFGLWSCSWRGDNEPVELDTCTCCDQTSRGTEVSARRAW
jgi:hypothetical protein